MRRDLIVLAVIAVVVVLYFGMLQMAYNPWSHSECEYLDGGNRLSCGYWMYQTVGYPDGPVVSRQVWNISHVDGIMSPPVNPSEWELASATINGRPTNASLYSDGGTTMITVTGVKFCVQFECCGDMSRCPGSFGSISGAGRAEFVKIQKVCDYNGTTYSEGQVRCDSASPSQIFRCSNSAWMVSDTCPVGMFCTGSMPKDGGMSAICVGTPPPMPGPEPEPEAEKKDYTQYFPVVGLVLTAVLGYILVTRKRR